MNSVVADVQRFAKVLTNDLAIAPAHKYGISRCARHEQYWYQLYANKDDETIVALKNEMFGHSQKEEWLSSPERH